MASQAYFDWVDDGRPWKFSRPVTALGNRLRAHGYTVYFEGNDDHLKKNTPEDHTPFSATGWPGKSPYPYCMAGDIMPPTPGQRSKLTGQPLPSLQRLAAQLRKDKIAGYGPAKFLKYLNWEPEGNYTGPCYHDSWQPDYSRRDSTDRGHIHYSGRSDYHLSTATDDYDLVARTLGEDDMPTVDEIADEVEKRIAAKLGPLLSIDAAVNPLAKLQIPDFAQPEASRRKLSLATWIGYTDSNRNADKAALLKAIAALPQVDTEELVAALAPLITDAVIAALPEDRDDITPAELQDAIVGALKVLVERPPATA